MKTRVAFIKFGGLSAGGTERWLQMMAANLPKEEFEIDYYYCDSAPYVGSDYKHADTDQSRVEYMKKHTVNLIKFHVGAKDIRTRVHKWVDTDFWEIFDPKKYDIVQTAKAGPKEYPYYLINLPVVEYITLSAGVDFSPNIACSIHLSQWQRAQWYKAGGNIQKSTVIYIPAEPPASKENLRKKLGIPENAIVAGFHQRVDNNTFSSIPLEAFSKIQQPNWHFVIKGGGDSYKKQAKKLKLKNVHFVEHTGDAKAISEFLNMLDIFAHGRKDGETFGVVFAEAMMHGKPCISHWSPIANAQPETMGPAGMFAKDADDYAEKLKELFSDEKLRKKLSEKARPHAEEYYSLKSCVESLANVYREIMKKPKIKTAERISYGQSPLGFLYAGELENPFKIEHQVVSQKINNEFCVHLFKHFLSNINLLVDGGMGNGLYCFIASNETNSIKSFLYEPKKKESTILNKTIYLNNWENRITVSNVLNIPEDKKIDFIRIGKSVNKEFYDFLEKRIKDKPVILMEINEKDDEKLNLIKNNEYVVFNCGNFSIKKTDKIKSSNSSCLCLHQERHRLEIKEIKNWAKQYKWIQMRKLRESVKESIKNPKWTAVVMIGKYKKLKNLVFKKIHIF